ncbi:MAG TPA: MFS transporter [Gaiellaceae bacterium]|nr:MFS transporter [Gaiellaceae bacterium]
MTHSSDARPYTTRTLLVLGLAALAFALAQTTLIPALPDLARTLHTDAAGVTWTLTAYLVAAAVCTPLVGRLGDIYGKRRLLVITLLAFAAGSIVAALSANLWIVVAGRVVQGIGGGILPLCFAIIRDEFPRERVARGVGLMSAIAGIGGGLGLVLGGVLVDHASYHWIFWLGGAMGIVAAVATELLVPESPIRTPARLDVRGALVLAVGLVLPLIAISRAHQVWGSSQTLLLIGGGLVVLGFWVALERRTREPLADIDALTRPPVLITNVATLLVGFGMFGSFVVIPTLAEAATSTGYGLGLDATRAGVLLMPGAFAMLVFGPLSGIVGTRLGNKVPLAAGGFLTALGLALLAVAHESQLEIILFSLVMSAGIGLAFAAMPNLIIEAVPAQQTGEATGFNALVRSVGSSLGSQVSATILASSAVAGIPTDSGYTRAFAVSAVVAAGAGVAAVFIPRAPGHQHAPPLNELGAASPLGEPAYARDEG